MYHSITIGDKNTWDDWHLIPASRPLFNPPAVKTNLIEIPGGDGSLDLTRSLAGRATYKNRIGSWNFYVENGFREWADLYSEIMLYLHGQQMRAILEDDPNYYYEGLFSVNSWKSDAQRSTIVIDYNVHPYKRFVRSIDEEWLWDPFNFETDLIPNYTNIPINGSYNVAIIGGAMPTIPIIIASAAGMSVVFNDQEYTLTKGFNDIHEIVIQNGENLLVFKGVGTVTIQVERGWL